MANLKEVRNRIASVNSTKQITSAMKMVSAAKLRRAQDAVLQLRPYAEKLHEILANVSGSLDSSEGVYSSDRKIQNVLLMPVTSNRGLCGGFNNNVIKETFRLAQEEYKDEFVSILSVGKKARDIFRKTEYTVKGTGLPRRLYELFDDLTYDNAAEVCQKLMDAYTNRGIDKIVLVYNKFRNAAVQDLTVEQLLPVVPSSAEEETNEQASKMVSDYIFEPNREEIVKNIIPKAIKIQFYKAVLDSFAAEHGARMTAMHKATDNAEDLIRELKLIYNKERQAAITGEILEIVGGAEALNS